MSSILRGLRGLFDIFLKLWCVRPGIMSHNFSLIITFATFCTSSSSFFVVWAVASGCMFVWVSKRSATWGVWIRWNGTVDWTGLDWTGLDWTGLDWNAHNYCACADTGSSNSCSQGVHVGEGGWIRSNQLGNMALYGKGTAENPILLMDSPARSPVKVLPGNQFRYEGCYQSCVVP